MAARKHATKLFASAFVALAVVFALAGQAFAAPDVRGTDSHASGSALSSGGIDVALVGGQTGDMVFVSVSRADTVIAKHIPYTLGQGEVRGEGDNWTGIVSLDIETLDLAHLDGTYKVSIYASRTDDQPIYTGAIYGVYADLPNGEESKLIGTRTVGGGDSPDRAFVPNDTLYAGGRTYRLASDEPAAEGGILHFAYEEYDESGTVDGVVKYVDQAGNVVATTKIAGLEQGEQRAVKIPAAVTAENGDVYRTVFFRSEVMASTPGSASFTIPVAKMSDADKAAANYYIAAIQLVDENDRVIATDSVNVTGTYRYTAPSTIYKTEPTAEAAGERAVVSYSLQPGQAQTLVFDAAADNVTSGERVVKVRYDSSPFDAPEIPVTFNLVDGTKRVNEDGRVLGTLSTTVSASQPTAAPEATIEHDGVTYHLAGDPSDYAYTRGSGKVPVVNAYYTPEGYEPPGAYDVTISYVNFLTGETITTETFTSDPSSNSALEVNTPEEFPFNGVDYVKLAGQEAPIEHSYYSGITNYTVYYRDKNDVLTSGTVINTIRVVYADGATAGGDATVAPGATADDAAAADDALALDGQRTYNVLDGEGNNSSLTNESGVDSNTERIEDEETPLASGLDAASQGSSEEGVGAPFGTPLPIGVIIASALAVVLAVVVFRRFKDEDGKEA